ncbi:MAG: hypothetical protein MZV49_05150 [Rhodopseudomonas palustris]|nr:hypothetical protein [Rhodopseudomonas palustris]
MIPSKDELLRLEGIDMLLIPIGGTYHDRPQGRRQAYIHNQAEDSHAHALQHAAGIKRLLPLSDFLDGKENVQYAKPGEYMLDKTGIEWAFPEVSRPYAQSDDLKMSVCNITNA